MRWSEWTETAVVEPSLYAADFARLGEQIDQLLQSGVRIFHFDVGDGHFVEPITIGPVVLQSISERIHARGAFIDCHLMTETPEKHFQAMAKAGGDSVTVHYETCPDLPTVAASARGHGLAVGMAFKPETAPADAASAALEAGIDLVLCMSIEPGYSGQEFMPDAPGRIRALRDVLPAEVPVQVDGGVGTDTIEMAHDAGASLFVAGSAIFGAPDIAGAYAGLVRAVS